MNIEFKEIEMLAYKNEPLPKYTVQYQQLAYLSLRNLYAIYRRKIISKEQAKTERSQIKQSYIMAKKDYEDSLMLYKRIDRMRISLGGMVKEMTANECPTCKNVLRALEGKLEA